MLGKYGKFTITILLAKNNFPRGGDPMFSIVIARESGRSSNHRDLQKAGPDAKQRPAVTGCPAFAGHDSREGAAPARSHQSWRQINLPFSVNFLDFGGATCAGWLRLPDAAEWKPCRLSF